MIPGATEDPILCRLTELPPPALRSERTERVRMRCHEALARRRRKQSRRRSAVALAVDAACFVVLGVYLAGAVTEALRLGRLL
jgi:hypothetical protein